MINRILTTIILLVSANVVLAQKTFNVTIKLDTSIAVKKVQYQYYNGKTLTFGTDSIIGNTIIIKDKYYSPLASVNISYYNGDSYDCDFFVSDEPASITLNFKQNNNNKLVITSLQNATPIYDTTVNKLWAQQCTFISSPVYQEENRTFDAFFEQKPNITGNDSLRNIFKQYQKMFLNRTMAFLKQHPNDYFSFWYFINQVCQVNRLLGSDIAYLKEQLAYVKNVFPAKFTRSEEGKHLIENYNLAINPIKVNHAATPFDITTVDGKKLSLASLRGKYVLLDFWATWCSPCMAEMPFIREVRKKYPPEKFVIIGVSWDTSVDILKATAKKNDMNWTHYHDKDKSLARIYGINTIPCLILIDKAGNMVYKSDYKKADIDVLPGILAGMN
ncbi:TlpA family protein disulfide reductase [Mucilaginibacter antarcticus]|uniref:TlpA family protein disulfide reductase n=1 Tax=Mucilaginibacter antarcticus TaxID=1855725 RepID=A0ABW5XQH0_9SPHI